MRWLIAILLTLVCGCVSSTSTGTSTGGAGGSSSSTSSASASSSSSSGGSVCPQAGATCQSCTSCALAGPCASLYNACLGNGDCNSIDQCFGTCNPGDTSCQQVCYAGNPAGDALYHSVRQCVDCQQCPTACAGLCPN